MKNNLFIQTILLGQEKVLGEYTIGYAENNIVATGAILETEWFGDEVSDSSRIKTHNYERGSNVGWIKKISMWSNENQKMFQMTTTSTPQCANQGDVVDSFSSLGSGYNYTYAAPYEKEFDTCLSWIRVYYKYAKGYGGTPYEGGAFDAFGTNYISDFAFDAGQQSQRLTGLEGEDNDYISFGGGCLVGISAEYADISQDSWYVSNSDNYTSSATTGACQNGDVGPNNGEEYTNWYGYSCANSQPENDSWKSYDSGDSGVSCGPDWYQDYFNSTEMCCACGGGNTGKFPSQLLRIKFHYSEGKEQGTDECEYCTSGGYKGFFFNSCSTYDQNPQKCGQHDKIRWGVQQNATIECCGCRDVERSSSFNLRQWFMALFQWQ